MTDAAVMNFHLLSLKTALPGFQGYDALSIVGERFLHSDMDSAVRTCFTHFIMGAAFPAPRKRTAPLNRPSKKIIW